MNNNKPTIRTLSLIGMLAISNISFAAAREMPNMMNSGTHKVKVNEKINNREVAQVKPSKREYKFSELTFELEKHKLDYNNVFGLFLQFGKEEITLDKLQKEIGNKMKLVRDLKVSMYELGELYKDTIIQVWEKIDKGLKRDRKELDEKKVDINKLREKYKATAIGWFSYKYGLKDDSASLPEAKADDFSKAISPSKKEGLKK